MTLTFLTEAYSVVAAGNVSIIFSSKTTSLFILAKNLPKNWALFILSFSKTSSLKSIALLELSIRYDVSIVSSFLYVANIFLSISLIDSVKVTSYISKLLSCLPVGPPLDNLYLLVDPISLPASMVVITILAAEENEL